MKVVMKQPTGVNHPDWAINHIRVPIPALCAFGSYPNSAWVNCQEPAEARIVVSRHHIVQMDLRISLMASELLGVHPRLDWHFLPEGEEMLALNSDSRRICQDPRSDEI